MAEAKFNAAEDALRYTEIKAPFDCFISDIFKNSGEIVSAGMPVLLLKQEGGYKADISMALKDYSRLKNLIYAELVCGNLSTAITLKPKTAMHQTDNYTMFPLTYQQNFPKSCQSV